LRLDTDIDAQRRAEAFARQVGPRAYADPKILKTLTEALLAGVMVKFLYGEGSDAALRWRKVIPYGLLFAPRFYLVARIACTTSKSRTSQAPRQRASILRPTPRAPSEFFKKKPRTCLAF
jgi:hypothetical protein